MLIPSVFQSILTVLHFPFLENRLHIILIVSSCFLFKLSLAIVLLPFNLSKMDKYNLLHLINFILLSKMISNNGVAALLSIDQSNKWMLWNWRLLGFVPFMLKKEPIVYPELFFVLHVASLPFLHYFFVLLCWFKKLLLQLCQPFPFPSIS